jgi:uncharacterized Fe-S radical SAM superfamily protein PflX
MEEENKNIKEFQIEELQNKINILQDKVKQLETCPHRCEVCGKPTNGYVRFLFWTHYYCKDHYPPYPLC